MPLRRSSRPGFALDRRAGAPLALAALLLSTGACRALATTPAWAGGGLELGASAREADDDARGEDEAKPNANEPSQVGAKHILVMHAQSQRKPDTVTRTKEEARKLAQECLLKIRSGADFDAMVRECSDEPGAAARNGDLGVFDRTSMVKAFADAAFALKVGEVSEVVESPFGFHIIKRTE